MVVGVVVVGAGNLLLEFYHQWMLQSPATPFSASSSSSSEEEERREVLASLDAKKHFKKEQFKQRKSETFLSNLPIGLL